MQATAEAHPLTKQGLNWGGITWVTIMHAGVLLAPFTFTWSGLAVCVIVYILCGLGITLGYHRLLTHRSFRTPRLVEYFFALLGALAAQGGPITWVAAHRRHHAYADEDGDPHSPREGPWWAHFVWWMYYNPVLDDPDTKHQNVKDLVRDPFYRFLDRFELLPPIMLGAILYGLGELWDGVGLSWLVWGIFVRTTLLFHATWFVNSATHIWGYRNFETRDLSTNLWWVALLALGEGWHNNHHAYQRSARHGLRWWEFDFTFLTIQALSLVGLAREIHLAPSPKDKSAKRYRVIRPRKRRQKESALAS
jgi:fatty-acid desaturase